MDTASLEPPRGYRIKGPPIGAGAWKTAYRGVAPGILADVALLCYHRVEAQAVANDASRLLLLPRNRRFSEYVTKLHNILPDDGDRVWIVEELLESSIESLAPLSNREVFCEVARDLCRGLTYIHSLGLVHRDIKLDNCGIDRRGTGKIFDLGSVADEGVTSWCTILTRPPEVLRALAIKEEKVGDSPFDRRSDIWSMGATLFALRRGRYPFASEVEAKERAELSKRLAEGSITTDQYRSLKRPLDQLIVERAGEPDAQEALSRSLTACFEDDALLIMRSMLDFDPDIRPDADALQTQWADLSSAYSRPVQAGERAGSTFESIVDFLKRVESGQSFATRRQVERCIDEWERISARRKNVDRSVEDLLARVKAKVEAQWEGYSGPQIKLR